MEISRSDITHEELQNFGNSNFIKLPINNYLKLIDRIPNPPQIALINAVQNPKYRFITAVLNRRTGKTWMANVIGHLLTLIPGMSILIVAPNYSLSGISWEVQLALLNAFDVELKVKNAKEKKIELENGSTIRIGSVSQVDSVVGRSYDLIIFDEAALNDKGASAFNIQLRPTLDKTTSKAIFISTPRGKNWFYEFYKRGFSDAEGDQKWASIRSTWKDNPRVDMDDVKDAMAGMSLAEFKQEYESDFIALEGQIYNFNHENIIQVDRSTLPILDVIAGLDLGLRDATAFCVLATDGHNYYVLDEFLMAEKTTATHAKKIQKLIEEYDIDFIYIDSAAQQTKYDFAVEYDINTTNAKKSIDDGIRYVASLIDHNRLFVDQKCINVIDALDNYRWDPREGLIKERPLHNEYSHMADALRYALYTHSYNVSILGEESDGSEYQFVY